jgi:hypothetical protein
MWSRLAYFDRTVWITVMFARGSGTGFAAPLFIKFRTCIRPKVLSQARDIDHGKKHAGDQQEQYESSHRNPFSSSINANTLGRPAMFQA